MILIEDFGDSSCLQDKSETAGEGDEFYLHPGRPASSKSPMIFCRSMLPPHAYLLH